jgi:hypothetical protein
LHVHASEAEPGRFDWTIRRDDTVIRQSVRSFGSRGATEADGDAALRQVTAQWQRS